MGEACTKAAAIRAGRRNEARWKRLEHPDPDRFQLLRHGGTNKDEWLGWGHEFNEERALAQFRDAVAKAPHGGTVALYGKGRLVRFEYKPLPSGFHPSGARRWADRRGLERGPSVSQMRGQRGR